jgi:hypothetical protein
MVRYQGDAAPLSEHQTRADARAAAIAHARQFGEPVIRVHGLHGEEHVEVIEPDFPAPTPADVKGPHVEP